MVAHTGSNDNADSHNNTTTIQRTIRALSMIFAIFIITTLLLAAVATAVHAEDDEHEDDERGEREDDGEDDNDDRYNDDAYEDEDDESWWEFDDDFYQTAEQELIEVPVPQVPAVSNGTGNSTSLTASLDETIAIPDEPAAYIVDVTPFLDDDRDGVANKDDKHPGKDDMALQDSDGDGFDDRTDLFPGKDDREYMDEDRDGVIDSRDSDIGKATDNDHDGIDDKFDDKDDRSALAKILGWLGIVD